MNQKISISKRKASVGKTTLIAFIAEELANAVYSVVMLDLDYQIKLTDINLIQKDDSKFFDLPILQKGIDEIIIELPGKEDKKIIFRSTLLYEIKWESLPV